MAAFAYSLQSVEDRRKSVRIYCKTLIGHSFRGETSNHYGEKVEIFFFMFITIYISLQVIVDSLVLYDYV